ncbi:hypothetical protein JYP51_17950 [Ponticoccus gilvus]|nr:hypothetical protein [Enemella evansiae]
MILGAIAPRWPRAFSSVGLGSVVLAEMSRFWIAGYNSSALERDQDWPSIDITYLLKSIASEVSGPLAFAFGLACIFACYVIGEIVISGGRYVFLSNRAKRKFAIRSVKIAKIKNEVLTELYFRRDSTNELMLGVALCGLMNITAGIILTLIDGRDWGFMIIETLIGATAIAAGLSVSFQLGQEMDEKIEIFEHDME